MSDLEGTAGHGRKSLRKIKDEVKFYPHQLDGVRILARRRSFLLADEMGGGKAQPIGTPVATPTGWRPIGALKPGDVICRPSGGIQRVAQVHPQGRKAVARVTLADDTSTLVCWDHLWTVADGAGWRIMTTKALHASGLQGDDGHPLWELPLPRAIEGTPQDWPKGLDLFTLGFVYGGGLVFDSKQPHIVKIAKGRFEVARQLYVPNCHLEYRDRTFVSPDPGHPQAVHDFIAMIASVGCHTAVSRRSWPEQIRFAPIEERMRFFLGMLAAAGQVDAATGHRLGLRLHQHVSRSTLEGTLDLIRLLGGVAVEDIVTRWVSIWWPTPLRLWSGVTIATQRPMRAITGIGPAGMAECVCITVDDDEGLYVTEKGIITHNSLQALAVAAIDYEIGTARKGLIVCPATLKDNWASEIAEHTNFKAVVCHGTPAKRKKQLLDFRTNDGVDILVMNYEQIANHLEDINACDLDLLIFDEAHYLKTPKSKRTKACHKIAAKRSFLLTGSPMLNQPQELWGLLHRINPEEFPSFWKFSQRYCAFGGFQGKQVIGVKNRLELLEILDRYMLRRLKTEMVKLPDKNFIPVHVPLSPLQQSLYKEAETELRLEVPDRPEPMELENALTKILRLKQITGTPATLGFEDKSYKLDRCVEIAHELIESGEKVVIFTQFRGVLEAIHQRLARPTVPGHPVIPTSVLSGDVPGDKRVPIVHEWRDSAKPGVLLSMLQVGGVGLDFTAASNVIFVDKLYVPAMNDQAVDRLHRLSMDKSKQVNIYELLATGTVEDRVEKILARKRKMTDSVVDSTEFRKMIVAALHDD